MFNFACSMGAQEAVHEFVYARGTRELLHVRWDGNEYWLESASGYRRKSTITGAPLFIQL
jgi:hypothetical protein